MSDELCKIVGRAYLERKRAKAQLKQIEERARELSSNLDAASRLASRATYDPDPEAKIEEYPSAEEVKKFLVEAAGCLETIKRCDEELDDA